MDIPYTCGPGFACLATGQLEPARGVARHLRRIYEAQPELPHRFYYSWSRSRHQLITDFAGEDRYWCVVDNRVAADQRWAVGGIAAAFLSRLHLADPDPAYIDLARKYQAFSMDATDAQFAYVNVCKSSWGSALLYQITGDRAYREWSVRMGEWYLGRQHPDGSWHRPDEQSLGDVIELTLEFTIHLDTLIASLASRSGND